VVRMLGFLRRNLLIVAVLVLAGSATAYAASRIGADDLKGTRFVENTKTIKPGQTKNVKANCRKGELIVGVGYGFASEATSEPNATVLSFGAAKRQDKGRFPDQAALTAGSLTEGEMDFEATVTGWCLKQ
jgi:hypothetical protein